VNHRSYVALIPAMAGSVFQETVEALTTELAATGYQLLIGQSGYDESHEDALIDAILGRRPAGIVLTGVMHSQHARQKLVRQPLGWRCFQLPKTGGRTTNSRSPAKFASQPSIAPSPAAWAITPRYGYSNNCGIATQKMAPYIFSMRSV
jgi:hypothetical protein